MRFDPDLQARILDELKGYREEIDLLYDASVLWADRNVGDVIEELKAKICEK